MNTIFVYLISIISMIVHTTYGMDLEVINQDPCEHLRPVNVYEKIDLINLPIITNAADCLQLCDSLFNSDIVFWKERQKEMLQENPRLAVIVSMVATKKDPTKPLDPTEAMRSLDIRLRILNKDADINLYNIHKSYTTIINDISKLVEMLRSTPTQSTNSGKSLNQIHQALIKTSKRIEESNLLVRGMIKSNTLGKTMGQIKREERDKLGEELGEQVGKYVLCDVEYVTQILVPTISEILRKTIMLLEEEESHVASLKKKNEQQLKVKPKKKKPSRHKKNKGKDWDICDQASTKAPEYCQETNNKLLPTTMPMPTDSIHTSDERSDLLQVAGSQAEERVDQASKEEVTNDIDEGEQHDQQSVEDIISQPKPWLEYSNKMKREKGQDNSIVQLVPPPVPQFRLNADHSLTARILLGLADNSRQKLEMSAFVQLITEGLKGCVLDRKKCIHFMARSIDNQHWYSIAMHRLHKDDPTFIPRNTPYWSAAKKLLLEVGITESNLN